LVWGKGGRNFLIPRDGNAVHFVGKRGGKEEKRAWTVAYAIAIRIKCRTKKKGGTLPQLKKTGTRKGSAVPVPTEEEKKGKKTGSSYWYLPGYVVKEGKKNGTGALQC